MEKDAEKIFRELKDDVSTYAELRLKLIKLSSYERISKVIAVLSYGLLLWALLFITIQFALLALGFLLSQLLGSMAAGFGIVAALYIVQVALVIYYKDSIRLKVINVVISALNSNEHNKDATTDSTSASDSREENHDAI